MPIFEYHCKACGIDFEYLVVGNEIPACPNCESPQVNKLMSACSFLSKGAGGQTISSSSSSSSCGGCKATSCAGCGQ